MIRKLDRFTRPARRPQRLAHRSSWLLRQCRLRPGLPDHRHARAPQMRVRVRVRVRIRGRIVLLHMLVHSTLSQLDAFALAQQLEGWLWTRAFHEQRRKIAFPAGPACKEHAWLPRRKEQQMQEKSSTQGRTVEPALRGGSALREKMVAVMQTHQPEPGHPFRRADSSLLRAPDVQAQASAPDGFRNEASHSIPRLSPTQGNGADLTGLFFS